MENKAKRLLFVLPTAQIGGTRTSLLNLLSHMDKKRYQIDVMFLLHRGAMIEQFEKICRVLPQDKVLLAGRESVFTLLKSGKIGAALQNIKFVIKSKLQNQSRYEIAYKQAAKNYDNKYNCVIAFQEKDASEFARYIKAPKKIAWVHTDFSRAVRNSSEEWFSQVANSFDKVVFVSDACMNGFKEKAHVDHSKMLRIYNTFDNGQIIKKSTEYVVDKPKDRTVLVSVGRFCEQKCFDRVVEAASRLKGEGYKFKWYVIGDGELFSKIESAVKEKQVTDCVELIGRKANPYPYMACADAMILTSVFEAHPMVANESFVLSVPVVSSSFPAAAESVVDMYNGILCDNSSEGVYQGVKQILSDSSLLEKVKNNLADFKYDNNTIVKQVEDLIEGKI